MSNNEQHHNTVVFEHNFCESRLQDNKGPEYFNAVTSLFITFIPLVLGIPNNSHFKKVSILLILNGFFSFYYHFTLTWLGKHLDEVTMFLANFHYVVGLLELYERTKLIQYIEIMNTCTIPLIIAFNTVPELDQYFPYVFAFYCSPTIIIILDYSVNTQSLRSTMINLSITATGAVCWLISENVCNEITTYGHILWHLCFPLGIYRILLDFDKTFRNALEIVVDDKFEEETK